MQGFLFIKVSWRLCILQCCHPRGIYSVSDHERAGFRRYEMERPPAQSASPAALPEIGRLRDLFDDTSPRPGPSLSVDQHVHPNWLLADWLTGGGIRFVCSCSAKHTRTWWCSKSENISGVTCQLTALSLASKGVAVLLIFAQFTHRWIVFLLVVGVVIVVAFSKPPHLTYPSVHCAQRKLQPLILVTLAGPGPASTRGFKTGEGLGTNAMVI